MPQTTYGSISQRTAAWAATEMLAHAEPILVLSKFGMMKPIPKNKADNVKFRRPIPFEPALVPLVEGVTPSPHRLKYEDVSAKLKQYGSVVEITDRVNDLAEDPVIKDASALAGEQAAETIENVLWGAVKAGTNVFYDKTTHTLRNQIDSPLTLARLRGAVRVLKNNRGKQVTSMLATGPAFNTTPIEAGYIGLGHTDLESDIRSLPGFIPTAQYGSRQVLCPEEVGSVENVRFILSPLLDPFIGAGAAVGSTGMVATDGAHVDVYPLLIIAKDAYFQTPLKGQEAITPSVIQPDLATKSDPLGQIGMVGWKTYFTAGIANEAWLVRVEVGVTFV